MEFEQVISFAAGKGAGYRADPRFVAVLDRVRPQVTALREEMGSGRVSYLRLPLERTDLIMMQSAAERIQRTFTDVVVLGTGGSSLGAQALCALTPANGESAAKFPKLHFPDNLGPQSMTDLLEMLDLGTAHFLVISKSGNTAETLAQMALCLSAASDSLV